MQPLEISDFSGGITDNVFEGKLNCSYILDNFSITQDKKILSRPGSTVDDTAHAIIPPGNNRVGTLINYARNDKLFVQSGKQFFYRSGSGTGAYSTLQGTSGNDVLNAGDSTSAVSYAEWNKQLFVTSDSFPTLMRIYKDGSGNYQVRNAGMPAIAAPTVTIGLASTQNFVYAFHYEYTYTVGTQTFQELGPVTLVSVPLSSAPNVSTNVVSVIPVLTNAGGMNFDTTVIRVFIYRTINNGTNLYKIGNVTNGTTTFNDTFSDATIQTNLELYTNDGTLDYAQAPQGKYFHVVGNVGFMGNTTDTFGTHPFRLQQASPGNPNFWPAGFTLDVDDEVTGVKSVSSLPILLCKKQIFRIDGIFDSFGRGGMNNIKIHDTAGCISNLSCVEADNTLFWWGNDGVYMTDGYKVMKISDHLNARYASILAAIGTTNYHRIYGKFDPINRRILWAVQANSSSGDNDIVISLDLRQGISSESSFYTWSGTSFRPTALEFFNDFLYRADTRGIVFKHDPTVLTDPKIDTTKAATLWYQETIIWTLQSVKINFGGSYARKFVPRILVQAANIGNTTIQITGINDDNGRERPLKPIRYTKNIAWGDNGVTWGSVTCVWNGSGMINEWRRFPAKGLRLSYLEIRLSNALAIVENSDVNGTCTIDPVAKTAVLANLWPSQSVDYYLTLVNDTYTHQFPVVAVSADLTTLTLSDPGGLLPVAGTYKWELKGYQKNEPLNLLGYNLHWDSVDQNQTAYHAADAGNNA
jgi:hypothetical protein